MMTLFALLVLVGLLVGYAALGAGVAATIDRWYGCDTCQNHNSNIPPVGALITLWPLVVLLWVFLRPIYRWLLRPLLFLGPVIYRRLMRPKLPRARVHKAGP